MPFDHYPGCTRAFIFQGFGEPIKIHKSVFRDLVGIEGELNIECKGAGPVLFSGSSCIRHTLVLRGFSRIH